MHEVPTLDLAPGRIVCASFTDVGPDPAGALARAECDVLVSLVEDDEIERRYPEFGAWLAANPALARRVPIPDWGTIGDADLLAAVDDLVRHLDEGRALLLHCGAGMGRTGVVASLLLVALGADAEEALRHVRAHRPGAGPDSDDQRTQLERVARHLQESR